MALVHKAPVRLRHDTISRHETLKRNLISNNTFSDLYRLHNAIVNHDETTEVSREIALILIATFAAKMPMTVTIARDDAVEFMSLAICDDLKTYAWVSTYLPNDKKELCATCIADEHYRGTDPWSCELLAVLERAV
jgi:hypothetical protein